MVADRSADDLATMELPGSVQGIIAARLDGLDPAEKALLQDAAVVGKTFWLGAVAAVGGRDAALLERSLHDLERGRLSAGRAGRRSEVRPSTRSCISWFGTSPTGRSRAALGPRSIVRRLIGSARWVLSVSRTGPS